MFLWSGETSIFLGLSLVLGNYLLSFTYSSFWTRYSTFLELPLALRNQIFNANIHIIKEETISAVKFVLWAEGLYVVSIFWFLSTEYKMLPIKILICFDNKLECKWLAFLSLQCWFVLCINCIWYVVMPYSFGCEVFQIPILKSQNTVSSIGINHLYITDLNAFGTY